MKQLKNSQHEYINLDLQVRELQDQIEKLRKDKEQVKKINEKLIVFIFMFKANFYLGRYRYNREGYC